MKLNFGAAIHQMYPSSPCAEEGANPAQISMIFSRAEKSLPLAPRRIIRRDNDLRGSPVYF
jgi:hypothetical protein